MEKTELTEVWKLSLAKIDENLHRDRLDYRRVKFLPLAQKSRSEFLQERKQWTHAR